MSTLLKIYKSVVHGVAFIPLVLTIALTLTALALTLTPSLEALVPYTGLSGYFEVQTPETARSILGALLAAVISITVFGFSMMMVVVNQASSNYSPKVVETLLAQRSNQYILGVYVGSIVFTLILMMHIDSKSTSPDIPQAGLLVNMLLVVYCVLLFMKFINNISQAVRITSIIENIFEKTKASIIESKLAKCTASDVQSANWKVYQANHSGYFQVLRLSKLLRLLAKHDLTIKIIPKAGTYYLDHSPLFALSREAEAGTLDDIRSTFVTYSGEVIAENPMYGLRQLREVAVKALSPGINDPGVAILCIDYISELLVIWLQRMKGNALRDRDGNVRIVFNNFSFPEMVELSLVPIKVYSKRDYTMLIGLITALHNLAMADSNKHWENLFTSYAKSILWDADQHIDNSLERAAVNEAVDKINGNGYFALTLLANEHPSGNRSH